MRDAARDTAAESLRAAVTRLGLELASRCRNPASPRYRVVLYRGVWHPAGRIMARVFVPPAPVQYHSRTTTETNRPAPADVASVLRFT